MSQSGNSPMPGQWMLSSVHNHFDGGRWALRQRLRRGQNDSYQPEGPCQALKRFLRAQAIPVFWCLVCAIASDLFNGNQIPLHWKRSKPKEVGGSNAQRLNALVFEFDCDYELANSSYILL